MAKPQLPANDLSGFEVKHHSQVMHMARKPKVGKVLHPGVGIDHVGIVQSILRTQLIAELSVALQDIERCLYLWCRMTLAALLLGWVWHDHTGQCPDTPSFLDVPAQMQGQTVGAVERVLFMGKTEFGNGYCISCLLLCWWCIQTGATNPELTSKVFPPSRVDLVQDG